MTKTITVKELKELLAKANDDAIVEISIDGLRNAASTVWLFDDGSIEIEG